MKGNYQTVGLSAAARYSQCNTTAGNEVVSVLERARKAGKGGAQGWGRAHGDKGCHAGGCPAMSIPGLDGGGTHVSLHGS